MESRTQTEQKKKQRVIPYTYYMEQMQKLKLDRESFNDEELSTPQLPLKYIQEEWQAKLMGQNAMHMESKGCKHQIKRVEDNLNEKIKNAVNSNRPLA